MAKDSFDKHEIAHHDSVDEVIKGEQGHIDVNEVPEPDPKALRRALLKLDLLFLPAVTMVYFLSFLDVSETLPNPA